MYKSQNRDPGYLILTNQYHTSVEGNVFSQRVHGLHQFKCLGGTLFYDDDIKKIFNCN